MSSSTLDCRITIQSDDGPSTVERFASLEEAMEARPGWASVIRGISFSLDDPRRSQPAGWRFAAHFDSGTSVTVETGICIRD